MAEPVVRIWIQRVVYESTATGDVSSEEVNKLLKYLDEGSTRDMCYREIVNRALDDKTKDPRVLAKVVGLLKKYLVRFPPSPETLLYLDHFPSSVAAADGAAQQSLQFCRSLIQMHLRRGASFSLSTPLARDSARAARAGSFGAAFDAPSPLVGNYWLLCRSDATPPEVPPAAGISSFFDYVSAASEDVSAAATVSIDMFAAPTCDRIAIVAEFKMQSGLSGKHSEHLQKKRAVPKSVVYDQQKPLELSEQELKKLLSVVMNEDACGKEKHMMASKVLLKALLDGFVLLPPQQAAKRTLLALLRMMTRDDTRSRLHALNMLLNLAVHANLVTSSSIFLHRSTAGAKGGRGTTRSTVALTEDAASAALAAQHTGKVTAVLDAVWMVTCETLLRMVHTGEDSGVAWGAALNLVLLQGTELGKANVQKLATLDLRVMRAMAMHVTPLGDDSQRLATALLCNAMLECSPDRKQVSLSPDRFAAAAWPFWQVVELYVTARSAETVSNAFVIVFHHVMGKLRAAAPPTSLPRFNEQAATLHAVLSSMGTPWLFRKVFLHQLTSEEVRSLSGVISAVKTQSKAKGMTVRNTKGKRHNNKLLNQLDSQFVSDFFTALLKEGEVHLGLDPELEAYKERMLTHPKSLRPLLDTLEELLFSSWPLDRHHGLNWLFDLLVVLLDDDPTAASASSSLASPGAGGDPSTPVSFGGGRGAIKGRGRPLSSLRAIPPPAAPGIASGGPTGLVSPKGVNPAVPAPAPTSGTGAVGPIPLKGVSKEARTAALQKSPRAPGVARFGEMSPRARFNDAGDGSESPRVPQLNLPQPTPSKLNLAGSTPAEISQSFQKMKTLIGDTHDKLLTSPSAAVRSGYLYVVRRLLSYIKSRYAGNPERALELSAELIAKHSANLLSRKESDPLILMQLFDLLFEFIASDEEGIGAVSSSSSSSSSSPAAASAGFGAPVALTNLFDASPCKDTSYMQFLSGARKVSMHLLQRLDCAALKWLFDSLPPAFENVRVALLVLIAAMCNDKSDEERAKLAFQQVGQLAWFKNLLDDPNPQIAYHSSRFLSEYLQAQDPVQYSLALKKLIAVIPADKIAIDFFHVLALLGDSTYLTIGSRKKSSV